MWTPTPPRASRFRTTSSDNEDEMSMNRNARENEEKDENMAAVLSQLTEAINRNTEVMNSAIETMESMAHKSPHKTSLDESEVYSRSPKRHDKVTVEVKLTFLKITDIDTVNQQFEAEIFVQAKWEEPSLRDSEYANSEKMVSDYEEIDRQIPWEPNLIVMNVDGTLHVDRRTSDIQYTGHDRKYPLVLQLWRFKGMFKENLELEHFPVDVQDLTISISTTRSDKEVELIEDQTALSSINTKAFMDSQEWNLYKHIETFRDFTTVEYCSATVHPILHVQCRVGRKTGYFIWNIVFIMLLIISLTFAGYTIDTGTADRITVTITLFLTAVAFKLVVKQSLPTISYLTYLDVYVLASLIFLGMQAVQNSCMNAFTHFLDPEDVKFYDRWSMLVLTGLLIMFHVIFGAYIYKTASKRRRIMEEKDRLYKSKREFLDKYGSLPPRYDSAEVASEFDSILPGLKLR